MALARLTRKVYSAISTDALPSVERGSLCYLTDTSRWLECIALNKWVPLVEQRVGEAFVVTKSLTQSALVSGGVDLTQVSVGGAVVIDDVIIQNGGTAVDSAAHGATVALYTNNAGGAGSFVTDAQAKLGANAVVSGPTHTTNNRVVLESGKKVSVKATGENVTSAGTITFYLICRRLADGAALVAA